MKTSELKKILKDEANKIQVADFTNTILSQVNKPLPTPEVKTRKSGFSWHKLAFPSVILVGVVAFLFIFLTLRNPSSPNNPNELTLSRGGELIGKELFAVGNLVDVNNPHMARQDKEDEEILYEDAKFIHDYLLIGEMMFNQDNVSIALYQNTNQAFSDYAFYMQVRYAVHNEYLADYDFYYNEEELSNSNSKEKNTSFTGVMIVNDIEYAVNGKKEIENDEFETTTILHISSSSYVEIKQETEIDENEYQYSFYEDDRLVRELTQSIETEDGNKEMSIELDDKINNTKLELEFVYQEEYISCEYEREISGVESEVKLRIYEYDYYYEYHFNDNLIYKIDK